MSTIPKRISTVRKIFTTSHEKKERSNGRYHWDDIYRKRISPKYKKRPAIKAGRSITTVGAEGFEPPTLCL